MAMCRCQHPENNHDIHFAFGWWVIGSTLTPSINNIVLFISCGNNINKGFPLKLSECCGLGYLSPQISKYNLNFSQILNFGSFVDRIPMHK